MKKARSSRQAAPSKRSLREIPEVDFSCYQVRRNRFAMRVQKTGVELDHEGPSPESLTEIPEINFTTAQARRRPRQQAKAAALHLQIGKGRPPRGSEVGPTTVRSIRLPAAVWRSLEKRATRQHMTVHSILRTAVVSYLESPAARRQPTRRATR